MYAQLGTIRFEGAKGFTSLEQTFGVVYAQHERINGKPRLQATGDELTTVSFGMYLHSTFTDPEADIEALRLAMQNREILTLILGNGRVVGDFVIPSFSQTNEFTDASGNLIAVTLSVELLESFNDDPLSEAKKQAKNSAFATAARNSNVRSILPAKMSAGMAVTQNVAQIETSGKLVTQYTAAAEANPATIGYYSGKISNTLTGMEANLAEVQSALSENQELLDLATGLPNALDDVDTRIQNMTAILPITNISDFKNSNSQLQGSIAAAKSANIGISNQSTIRRL